MLLLLGIAAMMLGLTWMRHSLSHLFRHRLRTYLALLTDSPYRGFLLGLCGAMLLQGSTAVSLLTIGLVSGGILSFSQSIAVLLGANVGTCSTVPLLLTIPQDTLSSARPYLLLLLAVGLIPRRTRPFCGAMGGFCLMLEGFSLLREANTSLPVLNDLTSLLQTADSSPLISIAGGILLTFAMQSASSATLLLTALCDSGLLSLTTVCYIIYGNNIGSCLSSVLVSLAAPREAQMTAIANLILNLGGTILFLPFTTPLLMLAASVCDTTADYLIFLHTSFNLVGSLLLLPFTKQYAAFICRLCNRKQI